MHNLVVIEKADTNYSTYAPDVPGCVATGDTIEEMIERIQEALPVHVEAIMRDHESPPHPCSVLAVSVEVPEAALV
ncbi:MAG: type II toxin-antitoxin system HicB family antitoxin [Thermomicrobia bacterium]|nr:type II toxin-antitoxin system HicB family antitoxin [Thermomicrobia bacterium]MCA1725479.1 type II toxin-antitoxin system HicB family antitoxin [Thermomicrobia bacterium]